MASPDAPSVCIVGAGSMGIISGYELTLAGAAVTYLIRPHRKEQLSRAQVLYSYDDHQLKSFSGYDLVVDPAQLASQPFNFVVLTLDGASLQAPAGVDLVKELGRSLCGTTTGIILGSVGMDLRNWVIKQSGLAPEQITYGGIASLVYEATLASLPTHAGVAANLLAQADYAFRHPSQDGFIVDLSAPQVAHQFAELYERARGSGCSIVPAGATQLLVAAFAAVAAWELLGWPPAGQIDPAEDTWRLGAEAMAEFQRLPIFGAAGRAAADQTGPQALADRFLHMERNAYPLDLAEFNRYHHGGKVNGQDHDILREALSRGEAEGIEMPALRALIHRLPQR